MDRIEIFSTSAITDLKMMLETKPTMTQEQYEEKETYLADTRCDFLKIIRPLDEQHDD